jgi:hypothetical protein
MNMIEEFGLHDAVLIAMHLAWDDGTCVMMIRHTQLADCTLTFTGVSNLTLSRTQPWGPSQSINSASQRNRGQYEIEMQSGDCLNVDATGVVLARLSVIEHN